MKYFGLIMVWLLVMFSLAIEIIKADFSSAIILGIAFVIQTGVIVRALK